MRAFLMGAGAVLVFIGIAAATVPVTQNLPERGELAAAGVTGTTGSNGNTLLTLSRQATCLSMENTTDAEVMFTTGSTLTKRVPAYAFRVLDLGTNGVALPPATVVKVHLTGPTATTGYVEALTCSSTR